MFLLFLLPLLASPSLALDFADGDMEMKDRGPWNIYGTPVVVEKSTFARTDLRSLRVVTDNKDTMGGNYEGTSHALGSFEPGDLIRVSFWYNVKGGRSIVVGMGRGSFDGRWVLSGTDWTRADLSLRCAQPGHYNIWISQADHPTEFFLDDFTLEVDKRPQLGVATEAQRLSLTGGPLRLTLCKVTGALCGIQNAATGETYAPLGQRQPLLGLELLSTDGMSYERVPFQKARLVKLSTLSPRRAQASFRVEGLPLTATIEVEMSEDGAATFTGTLFNNSDRCITAFDLPMVFGVCPAADPQKLTLVHPYVCGQITKDATKSQGCQTAYPGRGVMGWMDLSGERGGIYLAIHDPSGTGTRLMALPAPGLTFDMSLTKEIVVKPGQAWHGPAAVLAVHEGDWHASADRYRRWAETWMKRPDLPQWIRDADGWVLMGCQNGIPFWRLPDIYRAAQWMGIEYLHVQGEGIDTGWFDADGTRHGHEQTYLYPSPKYGTPEELKAAIRKIHEQDGYVMFYFLFERWTPSHSTSDEFGTGRRADVPAEYLPPPIDFYYDNALLERPGAKPITENPFMAIRIMCLGAPGWQEWMRRWAIDIYARQYGADGFYWDVMGRTGPFHCFNARHGHEGQSEWAAGCAKVLETVIQEGRKINPDYSSAIEGCSDHLGQWNGFHLMSGATMTPNVFRYTFPEYLCVDGFSNTIWKLTQLQKAHRVFLDGERFDLHGYHQVVKHILNLRRRIKPFIDWPAVFKDTVGLKVSDDRVQARAFWRTDGANRAIALTMMNEDHVPGATVEVDLAPIGKPRTVHVFRLDGALERGQEIADGGVQKIPVPTDDVSAALIVSAVSPELEAVAWLEQIMRPGTDGAMLAVFFPVQEPKGLAHRLVWPQGFQPEEKSIPAETDCLQRTEFFVPLGLKDLKRWDKARATITWTGGQTSAWAMLAPPLVNGDMEEVEEGRLVYWGPPPCNENPGRGKYCIRVDRQISPHGHFSSLTPLKPGCKYRFKGMVKRSGEKGAGAHVIEYEEKLNFVRSAALNSTKRGEWETVETVFTTHRNPRSTAIYLYNFDEKSPAWFDALELEELPPER